VQGLFVAGLNWPTASESFEAAGLDSKPLEVGGGVQVTGLWRDLFAQASATRWSARGERTFVTEEGEHFPLGIPLDVDATFIDLTVGWESIANYGARDRQVLPYVGGGAGVVRYSERSPFAQPGDDLEENKVSYHVLGGVEVRLLKWLAVAGDIKFRYVPGLLGDGGVSAVLDEQGFHGFQTSVGLKFGVRRTRPERTDASDTPARDPQPPILPATPETIRPAAESGVMLRTGPVFLFPDATRQPLKMLEAGTAVEVLDVDESWVRVAFEDRALGRRVGYVRRQDVQTQK
jgi:hypothetical protein